VLNGGMYAAGVEGGGECGEAGVEGYTVGRGHVFSCPPSWICCDVIIFHHV